jgi:hypothetical protein
LSRNDIAVVIVLKALHAILSFVFIIIDILGIN